MSDPAREDQEKHYLVFERQHHSVVQVVRADTTTGALWRYIAEQNPEAILQSDGSVGDGGGQYPHPLAYIEANYKTDGEWQIRELPDWAWQDNFADVFCGESADGPPSVIADCRKHFVEEYPKKRARAFVWYLRTGTLVTFYQRKGEAINILKRSLWNWDGHQLTVEDWSGDYDEIVNSLLLIPIRWNRPRQKPTSPLLPTPTSRQEETPMKGSRIVVLTPDTAARFPDSDAVNRALRTLLNGDKTERL